MITVLLEREERGAWGERRRQGSGEGLGGAWLFAPRTQGGPYSVDQGLPGQRRLRGLDSRCDEMMMEQCSPRLSDAVATRPDGTFRLANKTFT